MKKVFIVSSILFLLMCSFYFAYNFLLKEEQSDKKENIIKAIEKNVISQESEKKLQKMAKILDLEVASIYLDEKEGKIRYYNLKSGGFWMMSFDGSFKKKIVSDEFIDLKEVNWNENGDKALLKIGDSYYIYNFEEREKIIKKTKALNWLNFGEEIVYAFTDPKSGKKTINTANQDGTNWNEVAEIKNDNLVMQVIPRSSKTAFWIRPDALIESDMTIVSAGGLGLEKKGDLKYGVDYLWSPEGQGFLRSYVSEKGGNNLILEYCESRDFKCTNLDFPTIASKCAWFKDGKHLICAQGKNLADAKIMPNDYLDGKFVSDDLFWKINIESGKKEQIVQQKDMEESVDATNLLFSSKEDFLFFINKKDGGKLFRISI